MRARLGVAAILAAVALAGCGSPGITPAASATLTQQVAAVQSAAAGQNWSSASTLLTQLRTRVTQLQAQGDISAAKAAAILASADQVAALIPTAAPPSASPPPPSPSPATPPGGHGKGKGNGDNGD